MYVSDGSEDAVLGRIEAHLSDGFTRIGYWAGGLQFEDVPTELIPEELRSIGTWLSLKLHAGEHCTVQGSGDPSRINQELLQRGRLPPLVVPDRVVLRLVDSNGNRLPVPNVLFSVRAFTTGRKNDFILGPFSTDADGVVTITKRELMAEATANIDTGLMDFDSVKSCGPFVEIAAMQPDEVDNALEARTTTWNRLLTGESERWSSIEDLCNVYRSASNKSIFTQPIRVRWDGSAKEYEYAFSASFR